MARELLDTQSTPNAELTKITVTAEPALGQDSILTRHGVFH